MKLYAKKNCEFFFNLKVIFFRIFFFKILLLTFFFFFFFSDSNPTLYDLRLLSEKFTFSNDFTVTSFTIYEFYEKLRLFKNI